jgi:hypothetical protein
MALDSLGRCFCTEAGPLCSFCVEATLTRRLVRSAERIGDAWGRDVHQRRPEGVWPKWDADTTGNLRPTAIRLVGHLHADGGVLDRLARTCAYHAGMAYRDEQRRSTRPT